MAGLCLFISGDPLNSQLFSSINEPFSRFSSKTNEKSRLPRVFPYFCDRYILVRENLASWYFLGEISRIFAGIMRFCNISIARMLKSISRSIYMLLSSNNFFFLFFNTKQNRSFFKTSLCFNKWVVGINIIYMYVIGNNRCEIYLFRSSFNIDIKLINIEI